MRALINIGSVTCKLLVTFAMDVAALGMLIGLVGPMAPLGKWASIVVLVGASAAVSMELRYQLDHPER